MKNIVSFETAKALKYAGFPQPKPETGQLWFDGSYGNLSVLSVCDVPPGAEPKIMVLILGDEDTYETVLSEMIAFIFAPTATDILEQLPGYEIGFFPTAKELWNLSGEWSILGLEDECPVDESTNAAEAAAAAWLAMKKDLQE